MSNRSERRAAEQAAKQAAAAAEQPKQEQQEAPQAPAPAEPQQQQALVPQSQGNLFAQMFVGGNRAWAGNAMMRDKKDSKGNIILDPATGQAQKEQYGVNIVPMKPKQAAEALDLKGRENKPLLDAEMLEQSDAMMSTAKGTVAALPPSWTLAKFQVKKLKNGRQRLTLVSDDVYRMDELEKFAKLKGVTVDELRQWLEQKAAEHKAKQNQKPIDV